VQGSPAASGITRMAAAGLITLPSDGFVLQISRMARRRRLNKCCCRGGLGGSIRDRVGGKSGCTGIKGSADVSITILPFTSMTPPAVFLPLRQQAEL
jgi:hypothetical protein